MLELISQPGLQFYVIRLSGTLTYMLTIAGRPPKTFELSDADFNNADSLIRSDQTPTIQGTDASAVGLSLTIVKNIGTLEMRFEGRDGATAHWIFDGLKERRSERGIYASVGTQTCNATPEAQNRQAIGRKLMDAESEAFIFGRGAKVASIICEAPNGTVWKVSKGGRAEVIDEHPQHDNQAGTSETTPIVTRRSNHQRVRIEDVSFATAETLSRYLYLAGILYSKGLWIGAPVQGHLRVDREARKIAVRISSYQLRELDIDPDTSNTVTWKTQADEDILQILHRGSPVFTSFHTPGINATGNDASTGPHTHKVHITDFIQALEDCLRPEVIDISTDEEDAATQVASQKRKRRYTAPRR